MTVHFENTTLMGNRSLEDIRFDFFGSFRFHESIQHSPFNPFARERWRCLFAFIIVIKLHELSNQMGSIFQNMQSAIILLTNAIETSEVYQWSDSF